MNNIKRNIIIIVVGRGTIYNEHRITNATPWHYAMPDAYVIVM